MMKKMLVAALALMLASSAYGYFIDEKIDSVAYRYKGYDEIPSNITRVSYNNQPYYLVSYTRNLAYSGSIVLTGDGTPVTDEKTLRAFFAAELLHQSYPKESTRMYTHFSDSYMSISDNLPENLSTDAREISSLMDECATSMSEAIESYDPDAAGRYLSAESRLMLKMDEAQAHLARADLSKTNKPLMDYIQSFGELYPSLLENSENMNAGLDYLTASAQSKIAGKRQESEIEVGMNIAMAAIVALIILGAFLKKKKII